MVEGNHKRKNDGPVKKYLDLFYMTPNEVNAGDIADLLEGSDEFIVDLWSEMNVLELELKNHNTVDFEPVDIRFKDPSDAAFVKNRSIRTIFAITLAEEDLNAVKDCFERVIARFSGFLCSDSPDFNPVYVGKGY